MNNMKYFIIPLLGMLAMLSCGKAVDKNFNVDDPRIYDKVYSAQAVDNSASQIYSFPMAETGQIKVFANFGGLGYPAEDISVKFRIAPEYLAIYNDENYSSYAIIPEAGYTAENMEVVIPKGQLKSSDAVLINIDTNYFEGIETYMLPVHIESVNGVSVPPLNKALRTVYLKVNAYHQYLNRSSWQISYSSQEPGEDLGRGGAAADAFDSNNYTYWSTAWRASQPGHPHWIAADMGQAEDIHGFMIRGRAANDDVNTVYYRANPVAVTIQVSDDGVDWTNAGSYTLENQLENMFYLEMFRTARHFKVVVTASYQDTHFTNIAEIYAF